MQRSFSQQEIRFIEILDVIQWVTRDANGILYGHFSKPYKKTRVWTDGTYTKCKLDTELPFTCIQWSDEEPVSREDILYGLINHEKFFTSKERQLIELLDKLEWICRNESGTLVGFFIKPFKKNDSWANIMGYGLAIPTTLVFDAIMWTDREPVSREEILK